MRALVLLIIMTYMPSALANASREVSGLNEIADQVAETKNQLVVDAQTQRRVLGSLYVINKKMKEMAEKRSSLTNKVLSIETKVKSLAREIAIKQNDVADQRIDLSKRVRSLYMLNGQSMMRILFGSQSGHEFDKNLKYLKMLADRDYQVITSYQKSLQELQLQRTNLKKKVAKLLNAQKSLKKQKRLLSSQQKSKSKLLKHIRAAKKQYMSELRKLRKKSQSLIAKNKAQELESALRPSFFEEKGQLPPPVVGRMVRGFGVIEDATYGYHIAHKGLLIEASAGSTVRSVFGGQVVYEGLLDDYGASVIVDHGDHFYTVYTNAESTFVSQGDEVEPGQEIALAASANSNQSRKIYFEIRHFSEAIDPGEWLQTTTFKQSRL
ncbi:MAG: peptidoglycan DD-metalloendopeptidase family protein [Bdellovibrionales bacterium]|nr:peptidoglycan DD-metalloendopeptidase family protein [Bdellovibrionales bacterium]